MRPSSFALPSFAKINLYLRVIGKREDGYHNLCTVFQTVSLHDTLTFSEDEEIVLTCDINNIPIGEDNLIIRAALALKERFGITAGARIHLEKRIPSPGGLGGGSSNAATALIGLTRLWEIETDSLPEIASCLGADVPFFLHGGTAIGTCRGDVIQPLEDYAAKYLVIVTPETAVSTSDAYALLNAPNLTNAESESILQVCRSEVGFAGFYSSSTLKNDFEPHIFGAFPEIERVKKTLLELGAVNALMSGSGSSVFGIFDKKETRQTALKALDNEANWRKFVVAAVSRDEYRESLERGL